MERLQAEFPHVSDPARALAKSLGTNTKVSNLAQMVRKRSTSIILVNDSDIRVEPTTCDVSPLRCSIRKWAW